MEIKTNIELLNEISAKLGGKSDASVLVEGLNNIANALGDTDPDQMVTVPQALETVLEYVDGGGGGGGGGVSFMPLVNVALTGDHNVYAPKYPIISNLMMQYHDKQLYLYDENYTDYELIESNTPFDVQIVPTVHHGIDNQSDAYIFVFLVDADDYETTITSVSNLVNCTYDYGNNVVIITDPTKNASLEASFTVEVYD